MVLGLLKLIAILAAALAAVLLPISAIACVCFGYHEYCEKKFGHSPLNPGSFMAVGLAGLLAWEGRLYYLDGIANHKDLTDAYWLIGLGAGGIVLAFMISTRMTNLLHGTLTTLLMLAVGTPLIPLMLFALFGGIAVATGSNKDCCCEHNKRRYHS